MPDSIQCRVFKNNGGSIRCFLKLESVFIFRFFLTVGAFPLFGYKNHRIHRAAYQIEKNRYFLVSTILCLFYWDTRSQGPYDALQYYNH